MHKKEGFILKFYSVRDAFEILKENKITSNIESVRRWLRQGKIKGIAPKSRKEGWQIPENELQIFMKKRLPESHTMTPHVINTTIVVNEEVKEKIRPRCGMNSPERIFLKDLYKLRSPYFMNAYYTNGIQMNWKMKSGSVLLIIVEHIVSQECHIC